MTQFLKISFLSFLFLISIQSKGQELDSLDFVYQTILDNTEFVEKLNGKQELLCDGNLRYNRTGFWEPTELTFHGKKVLVDFKTEKCPALVFTVEKLGKNKYAIRANIHKTFPGEGCRKIMRVTYTAILKTKKKKWFLKKENVDSMVALVNFF